MTKPLTRRASLVRLLAATLCPAGAVLAQAYPTKTITMSFGMDPVARGPDEFTAAYKKDAPVWEQAVKSSGATMD